MQNIERNFEQIQAAFKSNTQTIENVLNALDESTFFKKPLNGGWCIAEIVEHLLISDRTGLFAIVRRNLPTDRNPLEITELLNERRKQAEQKFEAPEPAIPKGIFKTRDEAIHAWKNNRLTVLDRVNSENVWMLAAGFEHPKLGMLTVAEWVLFMCWHSEHHLTQIRMCAGL